MTRSTLVLAFMAACVTPALAQTSSAPRRDLPQPGTTTGDWGELPAAMKSTSGAEGVGVNAQGNVYGAVVWRQML